MDPRAGYFPHPQDERSVLGQVGAELAKFGAQAAQHTGSPRTLSSRVVDMEAALDTLCKGFMVLADRLDPVLVPAPTERDEAKTVSTAQDAETPLDARFATLHERICWLDAAIGRLTQRLRV